MTSLHFTREGKGHPEPILFIQGIGVTGSGWQPQIEYFKKSHDVICYDNRGIGQSAPSTEALTIRGMADDARIIMDSVGWSSAHIVGHSMGGVIAQQLALAYPERVKSLSLLCTFSRG